ncbi:exopolysaccharide biosynthesis WecB/TagA/CpsF family protein [Sphingomonas sp. BE138]|uniref:WecB/TagA/CpsF family glycosyltransferase n=1 Tax=Sphingomonas sp. BE138 TaxID=2817845 RepID=UPI00285D1916|nr:WecB/TagA/CpsF family glycosyltransferase [Sphingomonas sp. BE138]MDR6788451.1 exopolysaccharide biosynthesis WecB/TagA/CpsF family protein [Sphingomonas sp. BE138]
MPIEAAALRREFLGIDFDLLDADAAVAWLSRVHAGDAFSYVVTPNVDHVVRLEALGEADALGRELWQAYRAARLVLCDSRVLVRLARVYGVDLPLAPGSDVTVRLFDEVVRPGDRIAIIGGDAALLAALRVRNPALDLVQHVPPMGMLRDPDALAAAVAFARTAAARFVLLAVGSPQQEVLAGRIAAAGGATGCALCIGASLDFIAGRQRRAPRVVQRLGLEWAHRLASQPGRLWRRYLVDGPRVFRLAHAWQRARTR